MQRETSERGELRQREERDRGDGSGRESLQTSEFDVLRTLGHQPQQANCSTELMRGRRADPEYQREEARFIEWRRRRLSEDSVYREMGPREISEWIRRRREAPAQARRAPIGEIRQAIEASLATNFSERNPSRERESMENIVKTEMWKSKEVQNALTQLMKETPGTPEWNNQGANLIVEYEEQLVNINEKRSESSEPPFNVVAHLDMLSVALKRGGTLYRGEIRPQEP